MSKTNDIDGKESSKRYWAKILIKSGLFMSWIAFIVWAISTLWKFEKENVDIPMDLIYVQLLSGLGALGFTLGERFGNKKNV